MAVGKYARLVKGFKTHHLNGTERVKRPGLKAVRQSPNTYSYIGMHYQQLFCVNTL